MTTKLGALITDHAGHDVEVHLVRTPRLHDDAFARLSCRTCRTVIAESDEVYEVYGCDACGREFSDERARDAHSVGPACPSS